MRADGALVLVQELRHAAGGCAVPQEGVADPTRSQRLRQELLDQRPSLDPFWVVLDALHEAIALVHQRVDVLPARRQHSYASLLLALHLLEQARPHARKLRGRERVLYEAVAPLREVAPHLMDVFRRRRQFVVLPVVMFPCNRSVVIVGALPELEFAAVLRQAPARVVLQDRPVRLLAVEELAINALLPRRRSHDGLAREFPRLHGATPLGAGVQVQMVNPS
mmetsp:Transcript_76121/g.196095  ORF Transcript_76121/g.196095 Transcript_76121/m.196095 type:complete len:222 (-) Transcript_76121:32-697(-)